MAPSTDIKLRTLLGVNGLVSILTKLRNSSTLVIQLSSTSSLSKVDYLRVAVLCGSALHDPIKMLVLRGKSRVADLFKCCTESEAVEELTTLLRVLLHARVLYIEEALTKQAGHVKRRRCW
eukprot:gnl/TRDRNA2_/TRDRNA2_144702_c0_seq1.p1 gnl/TRDRNA2_/TRDRNA2_144702_c0~~gnl/TRDRNA2_/TRDRNA2_144702_c0_seq1.p1  ORF type:complete len:121 (+),score=9.79 gnl/TRDRNA2_/TRDRNA2_144702_c0_seq1:126-488(+)